jgi:cell division septum initiation protein DivIVA
MPIKSGSASPAELIKQVNDEIDAQISELTDQRSQLARMISAAPAAAASPRRRGRPKGSVKAAAAAGGGKKRKVSAETKRKLKAAAKARWARYRAEQGAAA